MGNPNQPDPFKKLVDETFQGTQEECILEFGKSSTIQLDLMRQKTGAASRMDVVKNALSIYQMAIELKRQNIDNVLRVVNSETEKVLCNFPINIVQ